jgi:hypothetical protein
MTCLRKKAHERPKDATELEHMLMAIDTSELTTSYSQARTRVAR